MYNNLKTEMEKNGIRRKEIADLLSMRYATIIDKLNGKYQFKIDEAFKIKNKFFPNMSVEYLFSSESSNEKEHEDKAV